MGVETTEMEAAFNFAYAPPSGRLVKRLEQMAELGGCESSPVRIMQMSSCVLVLDDRAAPFGVEVCEDGGAVRVIHRGQQGRDASPCRSSEDETLCRYSRALAGGTPGAAFCLAEAPLRTWLSDGCNTSLVCFSLPSEALGASTTATASPSAGLRHSADLAASASPSGSTGTVPATLELLLGLERHSVLLECLHTAFSCPAGADGLALWCFELRGLDGTADLASSNSSTFVVSNCSADSGRRRRSPSTSRASGLSSWGGAGGHWRDLMGEAVTETLAQWSPGRLAAATVQGARSTASAGGGASRLAKPSGRSATRGSTNASTAAPLPVVEGPVHAASVADAIAALHAAFSRSSLWRRRDPAAAPSSPATAGLATGRSSSGGGSGGGGRYPSDIHCPLLEAVTPPEGPAAAQLFVRLGVRLHAPVDAAGATQIGRASVSSSSAGAAARRQQSAAGPCEAWTTLDLVFIGCEPPPLSLGPEGRCNSDIDMPRSAAEQGGGEAGRARGVGWALGPARELLAELVARQSGDTGIPRPLLSVSRAHGTALSRRLAPLLAGNVAPHLMLGLPASLPEADTPAAGGYVLGALKLMSEARTIRTVTTRSDPPPPLYGAAAAPTNISGGSTGSSSRVAMTSSLPEPLWGAKSPREEDRQVAALLRMRHSQERKDAVTVSYRKAAEAAVADAGDAAGAGVLVSRVSGAGVTRTSAEEPGGPFRSSEGPVLLERWEQQQAKSVGVIGGGGGGATAAGSLSAAIACGGAQSLDGLPWRAPPELTSPTAKAAPSVGGVGARVRGGRGSAAATAREDDSDFSSDHREGSRRYTAPAAAAAAATAHGSRSPRRSAASRTPSRERSGRSATRGGGNASSSSSSALLAGGALPAAAVLPQARGSGSAVDTDPGGTVLVGGMARLQRRLESLQRARRLRDGEAAAAERGPANSDRYGAALGAGRSLGGVTYDSDSSRSVDVSTGPGSGSSGCLYGSAVSGVSGGAAAATVAAAAAPLRGSQSPGAPPAFRGRSLEEEARAAMASPTAQAVIEQLLCRPASEEPQHQALAKQQPRLKQAKYAQAAQLLAQRQLSLANASQAPVGAAEADAAAAAAAERLSRLRSEFERLYQSLVSEVIQDAAASGGGGDTATVAPRPSAAMPAASRAFPQDLGLHDKPGYRTSGGQRRPSSPRPSGKSTAAAVAVGSTSPVAGGNGLPHETGGGHLREHSLGAGRASPNSRRSSEVAWAALPHQVPASGLYGALMAGYAVLGLEPPPAAAALAAADSVQAAGSGRSDGGEIGGGQRDGGVSTGAYGISHGVQYGIDLEAEDGDLLGDLPDAVGSGEMKYRPGDDCTPVADWRPGSSSRPRENATAAAAAAGAASVLGGGSYGGSSGRETAGTAGTPRGLERLLDSTSSGSEEMLSIAVPATGAEGVAGGDLAAAYNDVRGGDFGAALNRGGGEGFGGAAGDGAESRGSGRSGADRGDPWSWPSGGGGGGGDTVTVGPSSQLTGGRQQPMNADRVGSGSGSVNDDASLGSWNDFIARDAAAVAAALESPGPLPSTSSPLRPPPPQQPTDVSTPAVHNDASEAAPTGTPRPPSPKSSAINPLAPVNSGGADTTAPSDSGVTQQGVDRGSAAAGASFLPRGTGSFRPSMQPSHNISRDNAGKGGSDGAARPAAAVDASTPAVLRQQNQALLGVLERAAAGGEALQGKLYDMQLELMELRASMELQQASHQAEVTRLRRHLRRAAAATAAAEEEDFEVGAEATSAGPGAPSRMRPSAAASVALEALVAAYEDDIDGLQRQVADLVAGQRDLAVRCAEQELAALALDAVRSRRRRQFGGGGAAGTGSGGGGGGGGGPKHPAFEPGLSSAVAAPATPRTKASPPPSQILGRARAHSASSSPQQASLLELHRQQQPRTAVHSQRNRSVGHGVREAAHRRRHSAGAFLGVLDSSPSAHGGGGAFAARRGRLGASADSAAYHRQSIRAIGGRSDGEAHGSEETDVSEGDEAWRAPTDGRRLVGDGLGQAGGVSAEEEAWQRGRREMGALRSALKQAHRREAQLRASLAATQQQRRAALLEARVAAAEGVRRRWLETQAAELAGQLAAARAAAAQAAAARDAAQRDATRLRTEAQVLADQLEDMQRLMQSVAQMAVRSQEMDLAAPAEWLRTPAA